jgi:hypothetical protein
MVISFCVQNIMQFQVLVQEINTFKTGVLRTFVCFSKTIGHLIGIFPQFQN